MQPDKYSAINGEKLYTGNFTPERIKTTISNDDLVFVFYSNQILLINNHLPNYKILQKEEILFDEYIYFGKIGDTKCFTSHIKSIPPKLTDDNFINFRQTFNILNNDELKAAILAIQVVTWNRKNKFCGACGSKTIEPEGKDWLKICPECGESYYPRLSPAIIIAIEKNGKLLMAKHTRLSEFYAIIAGFVNPGETLEECVHREVKEETNIEIENLEYFGSQPWPFPDSLMIGFKAKYKSGILIPDKNEIIDLKWFAPDEIPDWGNRSSISRTLIDDFIKSYSSK